MAPLALMADAAGAITNGFLESSLLKLIRAMCWFHCKNSVDKKLNTISDKEIRAEIISDICILQLSQTPSIFEAGIKLFLLKWSNIENSEVRDFIIYFEKEWIKQNSNWFEGYNHPKNVGAPSTNNGNESINATIKTYETLRARLGMNALITKCN